MGQLLENRLIINEVGNVFLVQSGSTTSGFSQSLSISDVFNVSMSSNVGIYIHLLQHQVVIL